MGPIKDISALAHNLKKLDKQNESRKIGSRAESAKAKYTNKVGLEHDKAEISDAARNLLSSKTEASQYINVVKNTKIVDDQQIEEIRERVMSGYYSDEQVVNKITERLLNLPNYVSEKIFE